MAFISMYTFSRWVHSGLRKSTGFAGIDELVEPKVWRKLAHRAEGQCRGILQDLSTIQTPSLSQCVDLLDDISDTVCQVIDIAQFCRAVHSDVEWRTEAENVCVHLGRFIHELNTNYALYTTLTRALDDEAWGGCGETVVVAKALKRDFEQAGVHLDGERRDRVTYLMGQLQGLGFQFSSNLVDPQKCGKLFIGSLGRAAVGTSEMLHSVLRHADSEELRKTAWWLYNSKPADNISLIDHIVQIRHEIARIMGFPSYSHYALVGSLAATPEAVTTFLETVSSAIKPQADEEIQRLCHGASLNPWDREWVMAKAIPIRTDEEYVSLDACIAGLARLLCDHAGITCRQVELHPGEAWVSSGIRKLLFTVAGEDSPLGVVYLDLRARPGKPAGAAHFTLRCARARSPGRVPVVALVANISDESRLRQSDLEMVFHELGHALHSLLSRTQYQHLSGTRGPQDIVEIPSHYFENLASSRTLLTEYFGFSFCDGSDMKRQQPYPFLALQSTLQLCFIDQLLHSEQPPVGSEADKEINDLLARHGSGWWGASARANARPHLRFQHFIAYPAAYYCYLYAKSIATTLSDREPKHVYQNLLQPGAALPPLDYVTGLFEGHAPPLRSVHGGYYPAPVFVRTQ